MYDKTSNRAKSKADSKLKRDEKKWVAIQQDAQADVSQDAFRICSSLRKPRTFLEAIVYIFILYYITRSMTPVRAEVPNFSTSNTSEMNEQPTVDQNNCTLANNSSYAYLHNNGMFANQPASTPINLPEFRMATSEKPESKKERTAEPEIAKPRPSKKMRQMKNFAAMILSKAPHRLNVPTNHKVVGSILQGPYPNSQEETARRKLWDQFEETVLRIRKSYEKELIEELNRQAKADPIYLPDSISAAAVNKVYKEMSGYVLELSIYKVHYAAAEHYHGGNCAAQASVALIEAIKQGYIAELVTLESSTNANENHTFMVTGRAKNSTLSDPHSWGDEAVVIDYWAYGAEPITGAELRNNPDKYAVYFDKKWKWDSQLFSAMMPSYFKMDTYYKKYQQLRDYFRLCQTMIDKMLTTANDYILSFSMPETSRSTLSNRN